VGDSGFATLLSLVALFLVVAAVAAFVAAWRVPKRSVRIVVGILLLVMAVGCSLFSVLASLLVAVLGVAALVLAARMPRGTEQG
jgi:hypothetical protein